MLDTTLKVLEYNKAWNNGNLMDLGGDNASIIYVFQPKENARKLSYSGLVRQLNIFNNGTYVDYWSVRENDTRNVINANCNGLAVSVIADKADDAFAYLPDTGEILFAGKNTQYYGHRNISELS